MTGSARKPSGAGAGRLQACPRAVDSLLRRHCRSLYSVHKSARFAQERVKWGAADISLFFLPSYRPELSGIEPLWRDVKQHRMRRLSRESLLDLKRAVDEALVQKAEALARSVNCLLETA